MQIVAHLIASIKPSIEEDETGDTIETIKYMAQSLIKSR
jgi:hypothetical protein